MLGIPGDEVADSVEELFDDWPPPMSGRWGDAGGEGTVVEVPGAEFSSGVKLRWALARDLIN